MFHSGKYRRRRTILHRMTAPARRHLLRVLAGFLLLLATGVLVVWLSATRATYFTPEQLAAHAETATVRLALAYTGTAIPVGFELSPQGMQFAETRFRRDGAAAAMRATAQAIVDDPDAFLHPVARPSMTIAAHTRGLGFVLDADGYVLARLPDMAERLRQEEAERTAREFVTYLNAEYRNTYGRRFPDELVRALTATLQDFVSRHAVVTLEEAQISAAAADGSWSVPGAIAVRLAAPETGVVLLKIQREGLLALSLHPTGVARAGERLYLFGSGENDDDEPTMIAAAVRARGALPPGFAGGAALDNRGRVVGIVVPDADADGDVIASLDGVITLLPAHVADMSGLTARVFRYWQRLRVQR